MDKWEWPLGNIFSTDLQTFRRTWNPEVLGSPACLTVSTFLTLCPFSSASVQHYLLLLSLSTGSEILSSKNADFSPTCKFPQIFNGRKAAFQEIVCIGQKKGSCPEISRSAPHSGAPFIHSLYLSSIYSKPGAVLGYVETMENKIDDSSLNSAILKYSVIFSMKINSCLLDLCLRL